MKKSIILAIFILSACSKTLFIPYTGDKQIVGEGGFYQSYMSSKEIGLTKEYPDQGVAYFRSGLPNGYKCKLMGYVSDQSFHDMTKSILKLGGNTATQSEVSFPAKFENNSGFMDASGAAGSFTVRNNMGVAGATYHGYNVFFCKK